MRSTKIFKYAGFGLGLAVILGFAGNYMVGQTIGDLVDMVTPNANLDSKKADEIYRENRNDLIKGYKRGDNDIAAAYTSWNAASTAPEKTGDIHSGRYMMTFVNAAGYDEYVAFKSIDANMPLGTVIAKETFMLKRAGKFRPSPLFTMEKVGLEKAPDTDGWYYGRVNAKGRNMPTGQKFCHSCHAGFKSQDFLGYPAREVRVNFTEKTEQTIEAKFSPGDAKQGKKVFQNCASCHNIGEGARNGFGPVLTDVLGRQAGSYAGYSYSQGLESAGKDGLVWTEEELFNWLENPTKFLRDRSGDKSLRSKMPIGFDDPKTRNDVIAYLKEQSK